MIKKKVNKGTRKKGKPRQPIKSAASQNKSKNKSALAPPKQLTIAQAKRRMGGKFPSLKGRKHRYPTPSNEKAWTDLINKALKFRYLDLKAYEQGKTRRTSPNLRSKYNYLLFHSKSHDKWKRATRNKHRKLMGLKKGDKRVVHHENQRTMSLRSARIVSHCEHQKEHGRTCRKRVNL